MAHYATITSTGRPKNILHVSQNMLFYLTGLCMWAGVALGSRSLRGENTRIFAGTKLAKKSRNPPTPKPVYFLEALHELSILAPFTKGPCLRPGRESVFHLRRRRPQIMRVSSFLNPPLNGPPRAFGARESGPKCSLSRVAWPRARIQW